MQLILPNPLLRHTFLVFIAPREEREGLVRPDSKEVRDLLERELVRQETRQEQIIQQWQDRCVSL